MIVCSCHVISDRDIETALIEIMRQEPAPLPTPGVVWRHLSKRMRCCGCAPLAVETIYARLEKLEREGAICPAAGKAARGQLIRIQSRNGGLRRTRDGGFMMPEVDAAE